MFLEITRFSIVCPNFLRFDRQKTASLHRSVKRIPTSVVNYRGFLTIHMKKLMANYRKMWKANALDFYERTWFFSYSESIWTVFSSGLRSACQTPHPVRKVTTASKMVTCTRGERERDYPNMHVYPATSEDLSYSNIFDINHGFISFYGYNHKSTVIRIFPHECIPQIWLSPITRHPGILRSHNLGFVRKPWKPAFDHESKIVPSDDSWVQI